MTALDLLFLIRVLFIIAQILVVIWFGYGVFLIVDIIRAKKGRKK